AETFRRRDAGELVPGSRQEDARALGRGDPDHERRVVGELPEARLALAELRLGEPPLGDLLHDGRDADDLAMHAHREEILLPRALLAGPRRRLAAHLDTEPRFAGREHLAPLEVQLLRRLDVRQELVEALALVLGRRNAVHLGQALVDPAEAKIPIPEPEADRRGGEDRIEQRVRLPLPLARARRRQLRALPVRDVLAYAGPAADRVVVVHERERANAHVPRFAGSVDHARLAVIARAPGHRFTPRRRRFAALVGMHRADPARASPRVLRLTGERAPRGRVLELAPVRVAGPRAVRRHVDQRL